MIDYLDAPVPYIIGMKRSIWKKIKASNKMLAKDIAIFDINKNVFKYIDNSLPEFPKEILEKIYNNVIEILHDPIKDEIDNKFKWTKKIVQIRTNFLKLNFTLVSNYRQYYKGKNSAENESKIQLNAHFQTNDYLANANPGSKAFIKEFARSECFAHFIESMNKLNNKELLQLFELSRAIDNSDEKMIDKIFQYTINAAKHVFLLYN